MLRKIGIAFFVFFLLSASNLFAQQIVKSFPAPSTEPRGLAWDGNFLWCADFSQDSIYRIDPANGNILSSIPFDVYDSDWGGLTWSDDGKLWVANGPYIFKIDPQTAETLSSFHCPGG